MNFLAGNKSSFEYKIKIKNLKSVLVWQQTAFVSETLDLDL